MNQRRFHLDRRGFLAAAAALGLTAGLPARRARAAGGPLLTKPIPATGERIPVIGMGSWITFNVGESEALRKDRTAVLRAFFDNGGGMIDSSPMYGTSEAVIGDGLQRLDRPKGLFSATKVWTSGRESGVEQMRESEALWGVERFDLMQIHNLLDWKTHLETLLEWKEQGRIRYIGITTSHGSRHEEMERIMAEQPIDFVQFTYNILDREAEARLLPLAREKGLAVIANRPYRRKQLIHMFQDKPLPAWAAEAGAVNWPDFLLKFIVSHPTVTCAIPATTRVEHMRENMEAGRGPMPDEETRRRMIRYVEEL
jgi:diketogulonate reductase-like aldo/keto reductase